MIEQNDMTEVEMNDLLLELESLAVYPAMKKYVEYREKLVYDALRSTDPFKNPTEVARNQGIRLGLFDVFEYIELLKRRREEASVSTEEGKDQ